MVKIQASALSLPIILVLGFFIFSLGTFATSLFRENPNSQVLGIRENERTFSYSLAQDPNNQPLGQKSEKTIRLYMIRPENKSCKADFVISKTFSSSEPVEESLELLESISSKNNINEGYINTIADNKIEVRSVFIENGIAFVNLSSHTSVTNECVLKQIKSQIFQTTIQFSEVISTIISLNGTTL